MRWSRPAPIEQAVLADAVTLYELRRQIEDWLGARGIERWGHGHVSRQEIIEQIQAGQWHLVRDPFMGVAAAARLLWTDPEAWGADDIPAAYVHGLMVHRGAAERDLGPFILDWAVKRSQTEGVEVIRLDCVESNTALRLFYQQQGFHEVGRREFDGPWYSATLLEKTLPTGSPSASRHGHPIGPAP